MITSCKILTLAAFRVCMFGGDLSPLGEGTPQEQADAWLSIRSEYYELLKAPGIMTMLSQLREINPLSSKIERIEKWLDVCSMYACEELAAEMREDGYMLDADADDATYQQQLKTIRAKLAPMKLRLAGLNKDLPDAQPSEDEQQKISEQSEAEFDSMLDSVAQFMHFEVDEKTLTVARFCGRVNRLAQQIKAENEVIKKAKSHG